MSKTETRAALDVYARLVDAGIKSPSEAITVLLIHEMREISRVSLVKLAPNGSHSIGNTITTLSEKGMIRKFYSPTRRGRVVTYEMTAYGRAVIEGKEVPA